MSKNFKRLIIVLMVVLMVSAMAAACSGKDETTETDDSKTETTVAEDDEKDAQQEDANRPPEEEEAAKPVEPEREALTEEETKQSIKEAIKEAVISEYLTPNNIPKESFEWPSDDWSKQYIGSLIDLSFLSFAAGQEPNLDSLSEKEVPADRVSEKELMDVAFNAILKWLDENKDKYDSEYYYENILSLMSPPEEFIMSISF